MIRAGLPLLLAAVLGGCATVESAYRTFLEDHLYEYPLPEPRAFRDSSIDYGMVRRVLALPLIDESGHGAPTVVVSEALGDSIARLRRFEVVRPNAADASLKADAGPLASGRIPVSTIIDLGRRYGVDAVLFGTISRYRPYAPPSLAIGASLIDVHTGKVLWSVSDFVDATDSKTAVSIERWFEKNAAQDGTVFDREIVATSPRWFARFASDRVAGTLVSAN
ncbi:MAG: hypothetical protein ACF8XB_20465 [Planctomycetota bacterium JB042]